MSNAVVPFEAQLPAHLQAMQDISSDDLISGAGGGFPIISIKGKVFHQVRGGERTLITRAGTDDEPAAAIEVVVLRANPALSKTYYTGGYTDGAEDKPTCYSNDGIAPAQDAQEPQAQKCATCPHNQWGSKISENGSKVKACSDFRRLAVAPIAQLNDPMLLRVPAASLKALKEYGDVLKKRGVKYPSVLTKIGMDFSVAHPQLTFKPVAFLNEAQANQVVEMIKSDLVGQIIGINAAAQVTGAATPGGGTAVSASLPRPVEADASVKSPISSPAPAAPSKTVAKRVAAQSMASTETIVTPAAPKPAPKATTQASKVVEVNTGDLEEELDKVLSAAGFDDK